MREIVAYVIVAGAVFLALMAIRAIKYGPMNPFVVLKILVAEDLGRIKRLPIWIIFFVSRRDARTKKLLRSL